MQKNEKFRPFVLTIAGFDPSAGAGLVADCKTMEQIGVYGLSVCSAVTVQHESVFQSVEWIDPDLINQQIILLFQKYPVKFCKIGLLQNKKILGQILKLLNDLNPDIKIILDPVLSASSGFDFHKETALIENDSLLSQIFLLTPNAIELSEIGREQLDLMKVAKSLTPFCNVLFKGGHNPQNLGTDFLFIDDKVHTLIPPDASFYEKHGSGCVLSAAIVSYLALGFSILDACTAAKVYISSFLNSDSGLLGYHNI